MKHPAPFFTKGLRLLAACCLGLCVLPVAGADEPKSPSTSSGQAPAQVRNVGVEEFDKLRADKQNIVLDVRTAAEFAKGHIPGAINVDFNGPDFPKKIAELNKGKTYLVHCAAGVRSAKACTLMGKAGFKHLIDLGPGFRAWEKAGKPVEKKE